MNYDRNNREVCEVREVLADYTASLTASNNNMTNARHNICNCRNNCSMMAGFPNNPMYGHAYVPNQIYRGNSFTPSQGLQNGTMFPELVSPYMPLDSMRVIETLRNREGEW